MPDGTAATSPATPTAAKFLTFAEIERSPLNPRKHFDPAKIADLAVSIAESGLLHNLVARVHPTKAGKYELIAGESRHRAIEKLIADKQKPADAKWPVAIVKMDDRQALTVAIAENVQRAELTPLEEAEGFKSLVGMKMLPRQIGEKIGKTERFVQLRLALLDKLAPKALAALKDGRISLEHARELVKAPIKRQESILSRIVPPGQKVDDPDEAFGYEDIVTAEHLKAELRRDLVPAQLAVFDRKLYKAAMTVDPEDGAEFFDDPDLFHKLQSAAIEAKAKDLAKTHGGGVEYYRGPGDVLMRKEPPHGWQRAPKATIEAGKDAALFADHEGKFVVMAGLMKTPEGRHSSMSEPVDGVAPAKASATAPGKAAPAAKPDDIPAGAAREALTVRTHAMQAAIAGDPNHAKRCLVFALLGGSDIVRIKESNREPYGGATAKMEPTGAVADVLEAFAKIGCRELQYGGTEQSKAKLWATIVSLGTTQLDRLFANLVAANVSVESPHVNACWPKDHELAIARTVKANPAASFEIGEEFLGRLKKGQLLRIVADLKLEGDPRFAKGADALTATVIRKIVLDAGDKLKGYVPPWCRFLDGAEMKALLRATPKIDATEAKATIAKIAKDKPAAKPKSDAKPKPAAKPPAKPKAKAPAKAKSKSKGK